MSKSRDQITVNNVTLYILSKETRHGLTTVPITLGIVLGQVRKLQEKVLIKQCFSLSAEAFKIKSEVSCYLVT